MQDAKGQRHFQMLQDYWIPIHWARLPMVKLSQWFKQFARILMDTPKRRLSMQFLLERCRSVPDIPVTRYLIKRWVVRAQAPYFGTVLLLQKTFLMPKQFLAHHCHVPGVNGFGWSLHRWTLIMSPSQPVFLVWISTWPRLQMYEMHFLITLFWKVHFATVQFIPCRIAGELANILANGYNIYYHAGFNCYNVQWIQ